MTELAPASPIASSPVGVNVKANGTGVADGFPTGAADSRPSAPTWNTSIVLPLALVVTISCRPSGVKPTWPGELRKNGGFVFARPSVRAEPGIGRRSLPTIRKPVTLPAPPAFST